MRQFGLLGRTLKHSFSQAYFTKKFAEAGIVEASYQNFELATIDEFPLLLQQHPHLKGLNVTIPYKEAVIPYLNTLHTVVKETGACNCIRVDGGLLHGFNTDVVGFRGSLEPKLKPHHQKALILGTGGASKAIAYVLRQLNIVYSFVSRTVGSASLGYDDVTESLLAEYLLIINTTPLGMFPQVQTAPAIPYSFLTPQHFLYDSVYNPEKTVFLQQGEKQGAQICNGYEMLIGQAEESWRIWSEGGDAVN